MADTRTVPVALREVQNSVEQFDDGHIPTKRFAIVLNANGDVVGGITLLHIENDYLTLYRGHTGFAINEAHRRRGYATDALVQLMEKARDIGMQRLVATCRFDNLASERTIRKAGLNYEATVDVPKNTYLWNLGIERVKRFSKSLHGERG